ncbi:MAG: polyhydroxyalkanoate synthesis repressor PhaR [Myxococcota bacterium]
MKTPGLAGTIPALLQCVKSYPGLTQTLLMPWLSLAQGWLKPCTEGAGAEQTTYTPFLGGPVRHIKKYGNRRLYCTKSSAYVNHAQLADLIRAGEMLRITDAKSGEDLTRGVLLQLLMEQQGSDLLPLGLLHRLLQFQLDAPLHQAALQQLSLGLNLLDQQLAQAEAQWPWIRNARTSNATSEPNQPPADVESPKTAPVAANGADIPSEDPELDTLRERLAALEMRLRS